MKGMRKSLSFILISLFVLHLIAPVNASGKPKEKVADSIISIAKTQEGWYESDINKFTTWYYGSTANIKWCNIFVCWCADRQGVLGTAIPKSAACHDTLNWFKARNRFHSIDSDYTPQKGDLIFYDTWQPGIAHHIGFVLEGGYTTVDGEKCIMTIEGNTSDKNYEGADYVTEKCRRVADGNYKIMGYAHPAYGDNKIRETPLKVKGLTVKNVTDCSLKLSWNKLDEAHLYYYETSKDGEEWENLGCTERTIVKISGLEAGSARFFRVRGYSYGGFGKASKIKGLTVPGKAEGLAKKAVSEKTVTLRWNKAAGADSYAVFAGVKGESLKKVLTVKKNTATVKNLRPDTKYTFKIKAVNSSGAGKPGKALTVKTLFRQVRELAVKKVGSVGASLSWKKLNGVKKYLVYISPDGKKWQRVMSTKNNEAIVDGLESGKEYFFRVRAYFGERYGSYSKAVQTLTLPAAVNGVKVCSIGEGSLKLKWKAVPGADKYCVFRSVNGQSWAKLCSSTKTNIRIEKLTSGTDYYFRVCAVNSSGKGEFSREVGAVLA